MNPHLTNRLHRGPFLSLARPRSLLVARDQLLTKDLALHALAVEELAASLDEGGHGFDGIHSRARLLREVALDQWEVGEGEVNRAGCSREGGSARSTMV